MRRQDHVVEREQRVPGLQAIVLIDVEHGAGEALFAQRLDQRFLLHHGTAADVDQPSRAFQQGNALPVD
jgi:hypothetical protein